MLTVIPIAGTNIAWTALLKETFELSGFNFSRAIDESRLKLGDYAKFSYALKDLQPERHLFFSFIIVAPNSLILEISEKTDLIVSSIKAKERNHRLAYVSGSLEEWRRALVSFNSDLAAILDSFFRKIGLKNKAIK